MGVWVVCVLGYNLLVVLYVVRLARLWLETADSDRSILDVPLALYGVGLIALPLVGLASGQDALWAHFPLPVIPTALSVAGVVLADAALTMRRVRRRRLLEARPDDPPA
jgi:hypothetical protein